MKCNDCRVEMTAEMKFCHGCGKRAFSAPRSYNEMKMELEAISDSLKVAKNIPSEIRVSMLIILSQTLRWAMGDMDVPISTTLSGMDSDISAVRPMSQDDDRKGKSKLKGRPIRDRSSA